MSTTDRTITAFDTMSGDLAALVAEAEAELAERYPEETHRWNAPVFAGWVAHDADGPQGCVTLVPVAEGLAEVKRLFVRPGGRGRGHAVALMEHAEAAARADTIRRLRLETGVRQPEAIGLYLRLGWRRVPAFAPHEHNPLSICFVRDC